MTSRRDDPVGSGADTVGRGISGAAWQALVDSARDAYVAIDDRGVVTEWNRRATEMFGWDHDQAVGRLLAEMIVPPALRDAHLRGLRHFISTGEANVAFQRVELPALRADGRELEIELLILPSRGPDGRWRFHAFLHDVTEERLQRTYIRLLQEAAVAANEADSAEAAVRATLPVIQEVADVDLVHAYLTVRGELEPTGWWFPDPGEPFSTVTAATSFERGRGLPGRVARDQDAAWIADLRTDSDFPRAEAALAAGLRAAFAFPVLSGDRVVAVIELFTNRPSTPDDELLTVMKAVGTQLGRVFERQEAMQQLEALAEDRRAIVAIVGHELRGPLEAVEAATAYLAQDLAQASGVDNELMAITMRQIKRLRRLVDSFLTAQRLEADALKVEPSAVAVTELITQVASDAALEEVQVEGTADATAMVDTDHLSQILWNLLSNTVSHGRPPVRVTVEARDGLVTTEIRDAGPGVAPEMREALFDRFGRDPSSRGMGLGLSIARDLARVNDGDLTYRVDADGHAFVLELPRP